MSAVPGSACTPMRRPAHRIARPGPAPVRSARSGGRLPGEPTPLDQSPDGLAVVGLGREGRFAVDWEGERSGIRCLAAGWLPAKDQQSRERNSEYGWSACCGPGGRLRYLGPGGRPGCLSSALPGHRCRRNKQRDVTTADAVSGHREAPDPAATDPSLPHDDPPFA